MSDSYIKERLQAIKGIASEGCADIKDADNIASFCDEIYSAVSKLDNVVEELEDATEIVKQSDVVDDVCEWRKHRVIDNVQMHKTSCLHEIEERLVRKYRYCPYCGKKIKVVE